MKLRILGALLVTLQIVVSGCGETSAERFAVRDSLGIQILESASAAWQEGDEWELTPEPLLQIGEADGDSLYLLFRVADVHRSSDGSIVVANSGTSEIRFYDAQGRFVRSVGRRGEGPGEYRSIRRMDFLGDSIYVSDGRTRRVSVLAANGIFVRSLNLSTLGLTTPTSLGLFASGSILAWASAVEDLVPVPGVKAQYVEYHRVDRTGTSVEPVGRFFWSEFYGDDQGAMLVLPFGRLSSAAIDGDTFYYADGSDIAITQYSETGVALRILRYSAARPSVTREDLDRVIDPFLSSRDENTQRQIKREFYAMPMPSALPAVRALVVSSGGDLWVGEYQSWFETSPRCWWIFAERGQLLGSKCLPEGFTLHEVGSDFVLGVSVDELGTERVAMYGLVK